MDAAPSPQDPAERRVRELVTARTEGRMPTPAEQEEITAGLRQVYEEFIALRMHYQFGIDEAPRHGFAME